MKDSERNYKKPIILVCVLAVLAVIGVIIYNVMKSATLSIVVAPSTAVVRINGKEYANGQYKFFPEREVEVEVSSPEYQTQTFTIDLIANEVTLLRAVLKDDDGGYDSYLSSNEAYNQLILLEPAVDEKGLTDFVNSTNQKIAILDILPLNDNIGEFYADQHGFIVSMDDNATTIQVMPSDEDCGVIPCLDVYESNGDLNKVKSHLKQKGYNPDVYQYTMHELYLYEPNYGVPDLDND